jgi:hypothetical protein
MALERSAICRQGIGALAAKGEKVGRPQIRGKGETETRRRYRSIRHANRARKLQHPAGGYGFLTEARIVGFGVVRRKYHRRETILADAEAERLIAGSEYVALVRCRFAFLATGNGQRLQIGPVCKEYAGILSPERMACVRRYSEAEFAQPLTRQTDVDSRQHEVINRMYCDHRALLSAAPGLLLSLVGFKPKMLEGERMITIRNRLRHSAASFRIENPESPCLAFTRI